MKLLMESWRKFLNEDMAFGEAFEKWLHGEIPDVFPGGQPRYDDRMDVDEDEFGQGGDCKPQSIDPECLEDYGFEKIGEGSFREVWELPDNPNYVMKTATGGFKDSKTQAEMNKAEADAIVQTGYPELVPKVYDTAKDYRWIVVERVKPYPLHDDSWVEDFFPDLVKIIEETGSWAIQRYHGDPTRLFQDYLMLRREELKGGSQSPDPAFKSREKDIWAANVKELGGPRIKKELDERMNQNPLFTKLLELVTEQELGIWDIRGGNVGKGIDGRFVLLDLGYALQSGPEGKTILPEPRRYKR